jgi:Putative auto-transporter adhesin, head GIN domain
MQLSAARSVFTGNSAHAGSKNTEQMGLQPGAYNNTHMSAEITMPALSRLSLSGASQGNISGFKSASGLNLDLSGASRASGDAQAGAATFSLSGASSVSLSGAADGLRLDASGASKADLTNFAVNKANVTLSGASNANIGVKSNLDYDLSGASHLTYGGGPSVGKSSTSGASSVQGK